MDNENDNNVRDIRSGAAVAPEDSEAAPVQEPVAAPKADAEVACEATVEDMLRLLEDVKERVKSGDITGLGLVAVYNHEDLVFARITDDKIDEFLLVAATEMLQDFVKNDIQNGPAAPYESA